jgi:hypothetical protein
MKTVLLSILLLVSFSCSNDIRLWPDGEIPFIPIGFDAEHLLQLETGMVTWEIASKGRIKFINKLIYTNYKDKDGVYDIIILFNENTWGSFSNGYGCRKNGWVVFNNLINDPIILHELGHIVGFLHEHQRPDRDLYIKVDLTGRTLLEVTQFIYMIPETYDYKKYPYDLKSIMHYKVEESYNIILSPEGCGGNTLSLIDIKKAQDIYNPWTF